MDWQLHTSTHDVQQPNMVKSTSVASSQLAGLGRVQTYCLPVMRRRSNLAVLPFLLPLSASCLASSWPAALLLVGQSSCAAAELLEGRKLAHASQVKAYSTAKVSPVSGNYTSSCISWLSRYGQAQWIDAEKGEQGTKWAGTGVRQDRGVRNDRGGEGQE